MRCGRGRVADGAAAGAPKATVYESTTSILRALRRAEAAGATVLMPRTLLPGRRVLAYYRTAQGQVVGLVEEPM